jgi:hypothetical protein
LKTVLVIAIAAYTAVRLPGAIIQAHREPKPEPIPFDPAAIAEVWMPPPELQWGLPRRIRTTIWAKAGWILGLLLATFASLILLVMGIGVSDLVGKATVPTVGLFTFVLFVAGSIALVVLVFRAKSYEEHVLAWGPAVPALVTSVEERGHTVIRGGSVDQECFSNYQFQDQAGRIVNGNTQRRLTPGKIVTVIYDPKNPRHSCVYPIAGYKVVGPLQP